MIFVHGEWKLAITKNNAKYEQCAITSSAREREREREEYVKYRIGIVVPRRPSNSSQKVGNAGSHGGLAIHRCDR